MTNEQFENAEMIRRAMSHIDELIEIVSKYDYEMKPRTRSTSVYMNFDHSYGVELNEGEAIVIRNALLAEKDKLQQEFDKL